MPRNPECTKCILHQSSTNVCVWGNGEGEAFVVGEAPGRAEAKTGKPFMGESGQLLRRMLAEFNLEDAYITNVVKCRPPDNRKPEPVEIKTCKPYLMEEIEARDPKAILLLGATSTKAILGKTSITTMNGQVVEKDGRTYVCAFHPAYILRDPSKEGALRIAIGRYAQVLKGENTRKPDWKPVDKTTFDEFVQDWIAASDVSFDVETAGKESGAGLEWWKEGFVITSIQFSLLVGDEEKNWGLALPGHPSAVLEFDFAKELLHELVRTTGGKRVSAHNGKFDNLSLQKVFEIVFRLDSDTMLASHVVDENSDHGLKMLARIHCGAPDYDLTKKEKNDTRRVPIRRLLGYGCGDTAFTRRLEPILYQKMDEQERWLYNKVIMPAARLFQEAEFDGHYVDIPFLNKTADEAYRKAKAAEVKLNKMLGRTINWNAPSQVAEALYRDLGLVPTVFTDKINPETGERDTPSTSEAALIDLDHPIVKVLEEYRGHQKFCSTYSGTPQEDGSYVGGWRDFMVGPRLFISTKLHGTVTGRYSSRLHSTPRDSTIRSAITAPPGWTFFQMDLNQAELRVIAIISRDPRMLEIFRTGKDIHWYTLCDILSVGGSKPELVRQTVRALTKRKITDYSEMVELVRATHHDECISIVADWKEERKKAKGVNFGFSYGQSAPGFIDYAKLKYDFEPTLEESTQFRNSFFHGYRELSRWHERQKRLVRVDGFVRSMSGRKRRLPGIYSSDRSVVAECERQAINSPVQGFIGDYKSMIMVELRQSFSPEHVRIKGEQHDSVIGWIKNQHIKEVIPRMKAIAEKPKLAKECGLNFPIPLPVDIELGPWGSGEKWKP